MFKGLLFKQIKATFLEGKSPTLKHQLKVSLKLMGKCLSCQTWQTYKPGKNEKNEPGMW